MEIKEPKIEDFTRREEGQTIEGDKKERADIETVEQIPEELRESIEEFNETPSSKLWERIVKKAAWAGMLVEFVFPSGALAQERVEPPKRIDPATYSQAVKDGEQIDPVKQVEISNTASQRAMKARARVIRQRVEQGKRNGSVQRIEIRKTPQGTEYIFHGENVKTTLTDSGEKKPDDSGATQNLNQAK
jgi:hypothetical protein